MPKQPSAEARKNPRAPEVREGETWKQYIDRLRSGTTIGAPELSGIICATVLMGKNPDAAAKGRTLDALTERLRKQPSFRKLLRDPNALTLAGKGKGTELIVRMGEIRREEEAARRRYQRDASQVRDDARFLRSAERSMKDSFAACSPAQRERENRLYLEMIKRMDHARSLAEQGIPLDGKTSRELAQAVRRYHDAASKIPGGRQQAAASREALCVLKRLMPEEEFNGYCAAINKAHGAVKPTHRRYVNPADYGDALLRGEARSARDLMLAAQRQLGRGMTVDGCATVTAIMQISKGNPNAIIRREALETEIKKMKQPGSAFLRTMSDDRAREKYAELANGGNGALLGRSILRDARNHSVRSAQWQVNQSVKSAGRDGVSVEKLAVILAAREMAVNASASQEISNSAFRVKTEQIRSSPGFTALAEQYRKDPSMRNRINEGLTKGDGGKALEQEYQKVQTVQKEKTAEAPVLKKPEE